MSDFDPGQPIRPHSLLSALPPWVQESVHINRSEPSLWLAFDYADHDLFELIRFHREHRDSRWTNPTGLRENPDDGKGCPHSSRPNDQSTQSLPAGLMPHHVIKSVMWQMLNGLNYMHQNWVIHRDLKARKVTMFSYAA